MHYICLFCWDTYNAKELFINGSSPRTSLRHFVWACLVVKVSLQLMTLVLVGFTKQNFDLFNNYTEMEIRSHREMWCNRVHQNFPEVSISVLAKWTRKWILHICSRSKRLLHILAGLFENFLYIMLYSYYFVSLALYVHAASHREVVWCYSVGWSMNKILWNWRVYCTLHVALHVIMNTPSSVANNVN